MPSGTGSPLELKRACLTPYDGWGASRVETSGTQSRKNKLEDVDEGLAKRRIRVGHTDHGGEVDLRILEGLEEER